MSKRIVVVNDDTPYCEMMAALLADEGYETSTCLVGSQAHGMIRDRQPSLVILDIHLERPNAGWTVLEQIRLDPATMAIPVLVVSADGRFLREKEMLLRSKRCETLEKPFDLNDLLSKVQRLLPPAALRQ